MSRKSFVSFGLSPLSSPSPTSLSPYKDRRFDGSPSQREELLRKSTTLYVGNMGFKTTEDQIHELFSRCGDIKRVVLGLDRYKRTPCGFCFVEFYRREDAESCMRYVNGTQLDERVIRTDWDVGFREGRQFGRGRTGGQVRDEFRVDFDDGRGGLGVMARKLCNASNY